MSGEEYWHVGMIVVSVILVALLLFQVTGGGLGGIFGEADTVYRTRRGVAKTLFRATIVFGAGFVIVAILQLYFLSR